MPRKAKRRQKPKPLDEPLAAGLVPDSHTTMAECLGCGAIIAKRTSSGHCWRCFHLGRIEDKVGFPQWERWENYVWDKEAEARNATNAPSLPYETFAKNMPMQDMGLAPDVARDQPLSQYDDMIHMWDGPPLGTPEEIEEENRRRWLQIDVV
jgi:hypothetical protein